MMDLGAVVLGGNVFGWTVERDEAFRIFDAFVDGGGVSIDTADMYPQWAWERQGGESEAMIGEWMKARGNRARIVVATKVAKWKDARGLAPATIERAVEASLRRLQTDYIDLYYAHEDDLAVEQADYVAAFDRLVRAGKVRLLGASNFTPERLVSARAIAKAHGMATFEVSQDHYSLVERGFETTLLPTLRAEGMRELPYWSLANGFLSGKYRPGTHHSSPRAGGAEKYLAQPWAVPLLDALQAVAEQHRVSIPAVALAWLRAQPAVAAPITSVTHPMQVGSLTEAATLTLSPAEVSHLASFTANPLPGAPGPTYPRPQTP